MTVTQAAPVPVDQRWTGYDGLFGGYAVGLLADAAVDHSAYRLASLSANFVSRAEVAPVHIEIDRLHGGRSTEVLRLALRQGGRTRVHAIAELVNEPPEQQRAAWVRHSGSASPPAVGPDIGRGRLPFDDVIELRLTAAPEVSTVTTSWARLRAGVGDPGLGSAEALLTALLDTPTPGLFGVEDPPEFVPSLDYTVHFAPREPRPATDWVRLDHTTAWVTQGYCADEVTAWDADGRLLATLRQTRSVRYRTTTERQQDG